MPCRPVVLPQVELWHSKEPQLSLVVGALSVIACLVRHRNNNQRRPPHPSPWPIIGHLHLLNKPLPLHRTLFSLSQRYGPIIYLQLGFRPLLVISSSHLAKECFTTNDMIFASRSRLSAGKYMGYDNKILGWASYGPYWRDMRKLCTLQLVSAHRLEVLKHVRLEEVSAFIHSLFQSCQPQSRTVNMKSRLAELTFNIIVRMVAGKRCLEASYSEDSKEAHQLKEMIQQTFLLAGKFNLGDYLPFLKWLDLQGLKEAMINLQKKRDAFMQTLVNDHHNKRKMHAQHLEDFIDVLLSATDSHGIPPDDKDTVVKATALQIITAGTDTSAVTIEWALAALLRNPHILGKAQQELDSHIGRDRVVEESNLHKLRYLQAIVKETLRLYPAGPLLVPHESTEGCTVGGFHVPAGTRLIVNAWAIHKDHALWERPMGFDPERFLKGEKEIDVKGNDFELIPFGSGRRMCDVKGNDFELIPFGSGRRMCPGMSLELRVVSYTLERLLQSFNWSVPAGTEIDMSEGLGLTMPKAAPLEALVQPRLPIRLYSLFT